MTKERMENAREAMKEMVILQEKDFNEMNFGSIDIRKQVFNSKDKKEKGKYFVYVYTYTSPLNLLDCVEKMIEQLQNIKKVDLQIYDFSKDKDNKSYTIEFIQRRSKYYLYFTYTLYIREK